MHNAILLHKHCCLRFCKLLRSTHLITWTSDRRTSSLMLLHSLSAFEFAIVAEWKSTSLLLDWLIKSTNVPHALGSYLNSCNHLSA